jgi:hypothetical protein
MPSKTDPVAHCVGLLLVLAMLSTAAALTAPDGAVDPEAPAVDGYVLAATP